MTEPIPEVPPVTGYASIGDYELRTGVKVPPELQPTVQTWLNDASALIDVYLGDCKEEVAEQFPDVLTAVTVATVQRTASTPAGISSASVGGTSVSYSQTNNGFLTPQETDVLDRLIDAACTPDPGGVPGLGQVGSKWGGDSDDDDFDTVYLVTGRRAKRW